MNVQPDKQVVVFQVGEDKFALDILTISEIARYQEVRKIPRAPEFLSGVIDLRQKEIVPIVDLHDRLDLKQSVPLEKSRIIVAPIDRHLVGFHVDVVRDVMTIPATALEPPPSVGAAPDFLEAIIRIGGEIILLLNIRNVLSSEEKLHMTELRDRLNKPSAIGAPAPAATKKESSAQPKQVAKVKKKK